MTDTQPNTPVIDVASGSLGSWEFTLKRHPLNRARLARAYDESAPGWPRALDRLGVPASYGRLWRELFATYPPEATRIDALDCGTGTGAFAAAMVGQSPAPVRLDGIDLSPVMLRQARGRLEAAGVVPKLALGDVTALAAPDGAYDLVSAAHLLEHLPDPTAGLAEMMRVTRPGGLVVACLTRKTLAGLAITLAWRTHRFTPDTARALFEAAGLEDVRVRPLGPGLPGHLSLALSGRTPKGT